MLGDIRLWEAHCLWEVLLPMTYKSLLTDEIVVEFNKHTLTLFYWNVKNDKEFGFCSLFGDGNFDSVFDCKEDFIATAKRNGWTKWKFVE